MLSYTGIRNQYRDLTGNDSTSNLTFGDILINNNIRRYCSKLGGKWWFLEKVTTQSTVASQQAYVIPQSTRKIIDLYVTVGTTVYSPIQIEDPKLWKRVLQSNLGTSDRTLFYYRQGNSVLLAPTPGSSSNTITIRTRRNIVDLKTADYTTGTVTGTLASKVLTGVGTTFTSGMVGRFINFTDGDGLWYELDTFTSTTVMGLVASYEGVTVAGTAFTIGQMSVLPEAYQPMPLYESVATYWAKEGDSSRANMFSDLAKGLFADMTDEANEKVEGAYMPPVDSLVFRDPNIPEPTVPTSSFI